MCNNITELTENHKLKAVILLFLFNYRLQIRINLKITLSTLSICLSLENGVLLACTVIINMTRGREEEEFGNCGEGIGERYWRGRVKCLF
jgi:hypothetical protein